MIIGQIRKMTMVLIAAGCAALKIDRPIGNMAATLAAAG
jgi:hypothetical protein